MYEFPASPTVGDVANGYRFDGVGWGGGPVVPTPTEQYFSLTGLSQLDIPVPSWAKAVQIIGSMFVPSNAQPSLRLSFDGSTFAAGASDYYWTGPYHSTGSSGYAGSVATATGAMLLGASGADTTIPHQFTAELNLTKPTATTTSIFAMKSYAHGHDPAATYLNRTSWWQSWMSTVAQGANTSIKALRFLTYTGAAIVDGWLKVVWIGGTPPAQNGLVPEAPMDGGEYVRVNGVWREKSRTLDLSAKISVDIDVPSWAKTAALEGSVFSSAAGAYEAMQWSLDGSTFYAGTNYQLIGGPYHNVIGGYGTQTAGAAAYIYLDYPKTNLIIPHLFNCQFNLETLSTSQLFTARSEAQAYDNTTGGYQHVWQGYLNVAIVGRIKKVRLMAATGVARPNNSFATIRWN